MTRSIKFALSKWFDWGSWWKLLHHKFYFKEYGKWLLEMELPHITCICFWNTL